MRLISAKYYFLLFFLFFILISIIGYFNNSIKNNDHASVSTLGLEENDGIKLNSMNIISDGTISGMGLSQSINYSCILEAYYERFEAQDTFLLDLGTWNLTQINVSIFNLNIISMIQGENDSSDVLEILTSDKEQYAMPLVINSDQYLLSNITVYISINRYTVAEDIVLRIWNATGEGNPQPDSIIFNQSYDMGSPGATEFEGWKSFEIPSLYY